MKHLLLLFTAILVLSSNLFAQNTIENIVTEIAKNNTTLSALRKKADAEKIGNKTGIYLQNPEAEFSYLWGNPSVIGNRTDISIRQTFDFPTAYGYKNQISDLKNEQAELEYLKQLKAIRLETKLICSDLIYINALKLESSKRLAHAQNIAESYKAIFDIGETSIIEFNKAKLNLLNTQKELESIKIERNSLWSELARLNGGQFIDFTDTVSDISVIPENFEQWYALAENNNPMLNWLKKEIEISEKQVGLNRAMSLPKLQAGYMSESVVGEQFQGITAGISISLWENKNQTKFARAMALASESMVSDYKIQFYNHLKALHEKAIGLQKNVLDYRSGLFSLDNSDLLKKALDKGEISLINYLSELSFYYESVNKLLELERDLNKSVAELNQYM
ncbi:MAG: hypothetical protein A2W90_21825 [Bacteroidetes bacterium GWF2_42_66]|nr:MAG: hypothetical protein A2W92_04640 [Bacteroidetes bacterium GWA2_42_15]OFY03268.1 MAG: hypothetical protein A2W89_19035 [Bacteroidetes bacterium GWE2_42_39]OFY45682.1 MAG: hypothetical protein A2W90_21825 [Bacteroidetes bacterium GWF2_42_66]HBL77332.1 transporter [Prolixibacteraceae bacterium]HCR91923.1 transporter [Prolixibacteraceae bacterium]